MFFIQIQKYHTLVQFEVFQFVPCTIPKTTNALGMQSQLKEYVNQNTKYTISFKRIHQLKHTHFGGPFTGLKIPEAKLCLSFSNPDERRWVCGMIRGMKLKVSDQYEELHKAKQDSTTLWGQLEELFSLHIVIKHVPSFAWSSMNIHRFNLLIIDWVISCNKAMYYWVVRRCGLVSDRCSREWNKSTILIHVVESLKSRAEFCLKLNHWNRFVKARHPSENCNAIMKTLSLLFYKVVFRIFWTQIKRSRNDDSILAWDMDVRLLFNSVSTSALQVYS